MYREPYQTELGVGDTQRKHGTEEVVYVFTVSRTLIISGIPYLVNETEGGKGYNKRIFGMILRHEG